MYIKQAFKVEHDWWLYLVGVLLVFIGSQLGQIPFIAIITKSMANGEDLSSLDYDAMMSILDLNLSLFYYYCLLLSV